MWRRKSAHRESTSSRKPRWTRPVARWWDNESSRWARKTSNFCQGARSESANKVSLPGREEARRNVRRVPIGTPR
jgi:hypothetical protein